MKLKALLIVLIPVFIISILVIIKSFNKNDFSLDARQTHLLNLEQNQILSLKQLKEKLKSSEKTVLIDLRNQPEFEKAHLKNALNIPFRQILENEKLKSFKSADNELVLYSDSVILSTKALMILTQTGFQKLYLLDIPANLISKNIMEKDTLTEGNEVLKYKFQPDSTARLE